MTVAGHPQKTTEEVEIEEATVSPAAAKEVSVVDAAGFFPPTCFQLTPTWL